MVLISKVIELAGQRFGKLVVIRKDRQDKWNRWEWLCRCDCGSEVVVKSNNLRTGNSQSCGCEKRVLGKTVIDITGQRFGRLTVLGRDMTKVAEGKTFWVCECDCGNTLSVFKGHLTTGHTVSCKKKGAHTESDSWRHRVWADSVKEFHDHTCQKCGKFSSGKEIHAHHILSFTAHENLRYDVGNGACLCEECHKRFHKELGVMRNTREDFYRWLAKEGV